MLSLDDYSTYNTRTDSAEWSEVTAVICKEIWILRVGQTDLCTLPPSKYRVLGPHYHSFFCPHHRPLLLLLAINTFSKVQQSDQIRVSACSSVVRSAFCVLRGVCMLSSVQIMSLLHGWLTLLLYSIRTAAVLVCQGCRPGCRLVALPLPSLNKQHEVFVQWWYEMLYFVCY